MLTSDPNDPDLKVRRPDGQNEKYLVLSKEERAKGFVRPVRYAYRHAGVRPKHPVRPLTDEEKERFKDFGYVAYEEYPPSGSVVIGRYWTAAQLGGGCGSKTTMGTALSETYARDPKFYGATFCCACGKHFPVEEFVWDDDGTTLGS